MSIAPIILFVYNRPWHTKQTIESLQKNLLVSDSELFIFSDGWKNKESQADVMEVRKYIKLINGFKKVHIIENESNFGLANNIIHGVTQIINKYNKVIVLEDDLISSPYFLKFLNKALDYYEKEKNIFTISGYTFPIKIPSSYNHDVYIDYRSSSWGWGIWKDRWDLIDWEVSDFGNFKKNKKLQKKFNISGNDRTQMLFDQMENKIDSWAIRRGYAQFKLNKYTLFPKKSLIFNIGFDGTGIHCRKKNNDTINSNFDLNFKCPQLTSNLKINKQINQQIRTLFSTKKITIKKIISKLMKII